MSGPIPAGSPSVSASGRVIAYLVLDQRLAAQLLEELLRQRLISLVEHFVARPCAWRAYRRRGRRLAAHGEHLDPLRRDVGRRQAADTGVSLSASRCCSPKSADCRVIVSRTATSGKRHGDAQALIAALETARKASASFLRASKAAGAAPRGNEKQNRTQLELEVRRLFLVDRLHLDFDFLLADLQASLEFAAHDLRPDIVGMNAGLQRFGRDPALCRHLG